MTPSWLKEWIILNYSTKRRFCLHLWIIIIILECKRAGYFKWAELKLGLGSASLLRTSVLCKNESKLGLESGLGSLNVKLEFFMPTY